MQGIPLRSYNARRLSGSIRRTGHAHSLKGRHARQTPHLGRQQVTLGHHSQRQPGESLGSRRPLAIVLGPGVIRTGQTLAQARDHALNRGTDTGQVRIGVRPCWARVYQAHEQVDPGQRYKALQRRSVGLCMCMCMCLSVAVYQYVCIILLACSCT
jgi:hypothetical protein